MFLNVAIYSGKLFKKYVLDLLRDGEVSFKDKSDTENTLRICEKFGLPKAEEFICKLLKRKPRREMQKTETVLADIRVFNTQFQGGDCPDGYVLVPGNESYYTPGRGEDFCVMKYAASEEEDSNAVSRQGTLPWVDIERAEADAACRANGEGYHLITNAEWMTIARDIEATPENWSGGSVGSGFLPRGNSNSNAALASANDDDPYHGIGATDWTHKRTHTLSNGEVIWDMAGNVLQWVANTLTTVENGWKEFSDLQKFPLDSDIRSLFGPVGNYDSNQGTGMIYMFNRGAVFRGGTWGDNFGAGIFAANLGISAVDSTYDIGFRCAVAAGAH